jgi:hypothetical protein
LRELPLQEVGLTAAAAETAREVVGEAVWPGAVVGEAV